MVKAIQQQTQTNSNFMGFGRAGAGPKPYRVLKTNYPITRELVIAKLLKPFESKARNWLGISREPGILLQNQDGKLTLSFLPYAQRKDHENYAKALLTALNTNAGLNLKSTGKTKLVTGEFSHELLQIELIIPEGETAESYTKSILANPTLQKYLRTEKTKQRIG
jgi:hypothetical protein